MEDDVSRPPFPVPPDGIARVDHLPTVEAGIAYWDAVRHKAVQASDPRLTQTALSLRAVYQDARDELKRAETQPKRTTGRLRFRSAR